MLRAVVASAPNDHRLGANEAPPAILSCVYEGTFLPIDKGLKIELQYFTKLFFFCCFDDCSGDRNSLLLSPRKLIRFVIYSIP